MQDTQVGSAGTHQLYLVEKADLDVEGVAALQKQNAVSLTAFFIEWKPSGVSDSPSEEKRFLHGKESPNIWKMLQNFANRGSKSPKTISILAVQFANGGILQFGRAKTGRAETVGTTSARGFEATKYRYFYQRKVIKCRRQSEST